MLEAEPIDATVAQRLSPPYWTVPRCAKPCSIAPKREDVTTEWRKRMQSIIDETFLLPHGDYIISSAESGRDLIYDADGLNGPELSLLAGDAPLGTEQVRAWEVCPQTQGTYCIRYANQNMDPSSLASSLALGAGGTPVLAKADAAGLLSLTVVEGEPAAERKLVTISFGPVPFRIGLQQQNKWYLRLLNDKRGADGRNLDHLGLEVVKVERNENVDLWSNYVQRRMSAAAAGGGVERRVAPNGATYTQKEFEVHFSDAELWRRAPVFRRTQARLDAFPAFRELLSNNKDSAASNEHFLFHGCQAKFVDAKLLNGLDPRTSRNGIFGCANYFAEYASKCDEYTDDKVERHTMTGDEILTLLVCRVVLGNAFVTAQERRGMRRPPCVAGCAEDCIRGHLHHDSVYAATKADDPTARLFLYHEFMTYDRDLSYPEFVVHYRRVCRKQQ